MVHTFLRSNVLAVVARCIETHCSRMMSSNEFCKDLRVVFSSCFSSATFLWNSGRRIPSSFFSAFFVTLSLKEEETVQKGQTAGAQAPAKQKSFGGEPAPKKKKTASKPQAAKLVTSEESDESDGDEEEESKEEEEEEPQVFQGKAAKPRPEETGARAPFKQPARQSQPRDQPAKPPL